VGGDPKPELLDTKINMDSERELGEIKTMDM